MKCRVQRAQKPLSLIPRFVPGRGKIWCGCPVTPVGTSKELETSSPSSPSVGNLGALRGAGDTRGHHFPLVATGPGQTEQRTMGENLTLATREDQLRQAVCADARPRAGAGARAVTIKPPV